MGPRQCEKRIHLELERLEDRLAPCWIAPGCHKDVVAGILTVTPPGAAPAHALPLQGAGGQGLATAAVHSAPPSWVPS